MTTRSAMYRRRFGRSIVLTGLTIAALGIFGFAEIGPPLQTMFEQSKTAVGQSSLGPGDSIVDVFDIPHPLLSRDSLTLILFLDAHCGPCRRDAQDYVALAVWSAAQRVATRLVVTNERSTAAQFGRLAGDERRIMVASTMVFDRLQIPSTPSALLVDERGIVAGRWLGVVPHHLELLNLLGHMKRPGM
jgi:hypothetical protein